MKLAAWRWLTGLFFLFMLSIAVAADRGTIPVGIRDIYRFPGGDWLGHFGLYGMLTFLGAHAFPIDTRISRYSFPLAALLTALLALIEEISQFWFPLRTPSLFDLAFGLLGIICAAWLSRRTG